MYICICPMYWVTIAVPECLSTAALLARREVVLQEKKETIADIASSLVENPEDNVSTFMCNILYLWFPPGVGRVVDIQCAAAVNVVS